MALTSEKIVLAAFGIAEKHGVEALTMRSLAAKLGRRPSSLYNHIDGRVDLIERMRALIVEEIDTASFATKSWDEALIDWAESYLAAFAQRPNCIRLLATTPITDPSVFCMYENVVGALTRAGWRDGDAVAVMRTVEAHVLGSALDLNAPSTLLSFEAVPAQLESLRRSLEPAHLALAGAEPAFALGIRALVAGLRARLGTARGGL